MYFLFVCVCVRERERDRDEYSIELLLTSRSKVPLEKLTLPQPVKKFAPFYGNRLFITVFARSDSSPHLTICLYNQF